MRERAIASNFVVQAAGRLLAVLIGLFSIAILTRALGAEGFGEYTTAMTYLQLFGVVVDFGLTLTLIVMISRPGAEEEKLIGNIFTLRMISGAILFGLAPVIVLAMPWSGTVDMAVLVGSFAYVLMGGASLLVGVFQRHQAMWRAAVAEVLNRIVLLGFVSLFAVLGMGVVAMISASIFANAIWLAVMIWLARRFARVRMQIDWNTWKSVLTHSWPLALSIIFNLLYLKGDILFLASFRAQAEVGQYGVAYRIIDVLTALPVMYMGIALPVAVRAYEQKQKERFQKLTQRTLELFFMATIPIIVGVQVVGIPLATLIGGGEYVPAGQVLTLLSVALLGVFGGALFGHLVIAVNRQHKMIWGYAGVAILTIVGYLWLIPLYGMWGAAWMTVISETLIAIITYLVVVKTAKIRLHAWILWKVLIAAGVMYGFLLIVPSIHVLLDITLAAVVYGAILLLLGAIRLSDLRALKPETV